jgi:hypothetical protein
VSRVHCIDCDLPVVVDPNGVCPEGHLVGPSGGRIESAIGSDTPYPDEPEPWVFGIDDVEDTHAEAEPEPAPRTALPPSIPDLDPPDADPEAATEDLLRELQALSDLSAATAGDVPTPTVPETQPEVAVAPEPPVARPAPAAAASMAATTPPLPPPPVTATPTPAAPEPSLDPEPVPAVAAMPTPDPEPVPTVAATPPPPPRTPVSPPSGPVAPHLVPARSPWATDGLEDIESLFEHVPAVAAPATVPTGAAAATQEQAPLPAPAPAPVHAQPLRSPLRELVGAPALQDTAPTYEDHGPLADVDAEESGLDLANFTARGTKVGARPRRRRFRR